MFASSRYRAVSGTVGRLDAPRVVPPGAPQARLASRIYVSFQTRNRSANGHKRGEVSGRVSESPSTRGARAGGAGWTKMPDDRTPSSSLGVGTTRWASGGVINPSDPTPGASGRGVGSGAPSDGSRGWSAGAIPRAARGGLASSSTSAPRVDPTNVGFRMLRKAGWNVGRASARTNRATPNPSACGKSIQARRRRRVPSLRPRRGRDPAGETKPHTSFPTTRLGRSRGGRRRVARRPPRRDGGGWRDRRARAHRRPTSVARFARRRPARTRIRFSEDDASAKRRRCAVRNPAVSEGARGTTSAAVCRRIIPFGVCSDAAPRLVGCEIGRQTGPDPPRRDGRLARLRYDETLGADATPMRVDSTRACRPARFLILTPSASAVIIAGSIPVSMRISIIGPLRMDTHTSSFPAARSASSTPLDNTPRTTPLRNIALVSSGRSRSASMRSRSNSRSIIPPFHQRAQHVAAPQQLRAHPGLHQFHHQRASVREEPPR